MCEHKWVYQMSDYECEANGYYSKQYCRTDIYYCEKCCETKDIVAKIECRDIKDGEPSWWK